MIHGTSHVLISVSIVCVISENTARDLAETRQSQKEAYSFKLLHRIIDSTTE